jgi:hypothetical protein
MPPTDQAESNQINPGAGSKFKVEKPWPKLDWLVAKEAGGRRSSQTQSNQGDETEANEVNEENKVKLPDPERDINAGQLRCLRDLLCKKLASWPRTARFPRISGPISAGLKAGPTKSNQIKPNQTRGAGHERIGKTHIGRQSLDAKDERDLCDRSKPDQTKSDQIKPGKVGSKSARVRKCPNIGHSGGERGRLDAARSDSVRPSQTIN